MNTRFQSNCLILADFFAFYLSFAFGITILVAYTGYTNASEFSEWYLSTGVSHLLTFSVFVVFAIGRLASVGLYQKRILFWDELPLILETVFIFAILHGALVWIFHSPMAKSLWLVSWATSPFAIMLSRAGMKKVLMKTGLWQLKAVCIGTDFLAQQFLRLTQMEPTLGIDIQDCLAVPIQPDGEMSDFFKKIRSLGNFNFLIVATQDASAFKLYQILVNEFSAVHLVPPLQGISLLGLQTQFFFSHEVFLLSPQSPWIQRSQEKFKRILDVVGAGILLIFLSPLIVFLTVAIRMSGPKVFFKQRRHGYKGELFECIKFRTMVLDAEAKLQAVLESDPIAKKEWEEKTKISNDPRITQIGQFMRRTSLDELPQLWNVFRGDMSLVGPRPILLHEDVKYGKDLLVYKKFRPGMTGLWQVSGRSNTSYEFRIFLDSWYVRNWSPWYDLAILIKTLGVIFEKKGAY